MSVSPNIRESLAYLGRKQGNNPGMDRLKNIKRQSYIARQVVFTDFLVPRPSYGPSTSLFKFYKKNFLSVSSTITLTGRVLPDIWLVKLLNTNITCSIYLFLALFQ